MRHLLYLIILLLGCGEVVDDTVQQQEAKPSPSVGKADDTQPDEEPVSEPEGRYFSQWDNQLYPGSTCQNTTVAMLLSRYGWEGSPDDITREWGKDYAQSPRGLSNVFNYYAMIDDISWRLQPEMEGSLEEFRERLLRGIPTPVHGYFTSYGHVVLAMRFDGVEYTVMDPAGCWVQRFGGGYDPTCLSGDTIKYPKEAFESAVATSDGYSFLSMWFHRLAETHTVLP